LAQSVAKKQQLLQATS